MNSPVSFLTNLRQDRLQRSEMFSLIKLSTRRSVAEGILNYIYLDSTLYALKMKLL